MLFYENSSELILNERGIIVICVNQRTAVGMLSYNLDGCVNNIQVDAGPAVTPAGS